MPADHTGSLTPSHTRAMRERGEGYILSITTAPEGWFARVLRHGDTAASVHAETLPLAVARAAVLALLPDATPEARALLTPEVSGDSTPTA